MVVHVPARRPPVTEKSHGTASLGPLPERYWVRVSCALMGRAQPATESSTARWSNTGTMQRFMVDSTISHLRRQRVAT